MHVFTPGMKVIDELCGTRVCLLLVLAFVYSSASGRDVQTTSVPLSSRHPSNLTSQQRNSSVTIVLRDIDIKNRTAVDFARREVRRKILKYLKRKKSAVSSSSWTTEVTITSIVTATTVITSATPDITTALTIPTTTTSPLTADPITRVAEATTQTPTIISTPTVTTQSPVTIAIITRPTTTLWPTPSPARKRRRRDSGESNCIITEEDIIFVENYPETDTNGNLRISLYNTDNETPECEDILFKVLAELNKADEDDGLQIIAPVVEIFRGLPLPPATTVKVELLEAGYQVWLLILLIIFLLLIIFIFVCCWRATHKKKIIPTQDSKPSPSNGHDPPRILDDNYGWLVPNEQFSSEQK